MIPTAEFFQAVMQSGLDGAQRAAEKRGDVGQRRVSVEAQFENRAVFVRQDRQRRQNERRCLCLHSGNEWFGLAGRPTSPLHILFNHRSSLAAGFKKPMPQDAVEPSRKTGSPVEPRQRPPGFDEGFLGQVLGFVVVAAQNPRAPPYRLGVQFNHLAKRCRLAVLRSPQEFGIWGLIGVHNTLFPSSREKVHWV